ncbi:hypothetical protein [Nitrospirillum iridis]|uniref:Uncharacterized protein n=1 Tax=Nitrospirillum iridis TaxID=765888 RepID=A0A7X0AYQ4_9PROT|nr:hypothetical protein [Nitrospirillum iridis]MBB6251019.1 hypothetical protein [Nitrospirillum iridis]
MFRHLAWAALLAATGGCVPLAPPAFPPAGASQALSPVDPAAPITAWTRPAILPVVLVETPASDDAAMPGMDHTHHHGQGTP